MTETKTLLPTEEDVQFFKENGYWIAPKLFDDALLDEALERMERIYQGDFDKGEAPLSNYIPSQDTAKGLRKTDNAWWSDSVIEKIVTAPILGQIAAILLEAPEIYLWHDQMLYKPGGGTATGNVGWHQDRHYWLSCSTTDMVTAWVALDDVDEANGAMRFVPKSNRWGLLEENDFFNADMEGQKSRMNLPDGAKWEEFIINLKRGQASFHHCLTLHGSGPNTSERLRRSMAVHMMSGETAMVKGNGHCNEEIFLAQPGFENSPDGALYRGPRFPKMWPTE